MVNKREDKQRIEPIINEDDIFKSIGHQIREIIKPLGVNALTFTPIKDKFF